MAGLRYEVPNSWIAFQFLYAPKPERRRTSKDLPNKQTADSGSKDSNAIFEVIEKKWRGIFLVKPSSFFFFDASWILTDKRDQHTELEFN